MILLVIGQDQDPWVLKPDLLLSGGQRGPLWGAVLSHGAGPPYSAA